MRYPKYITTRHELIMSYSLQEYLTVLDLHDIHCKEAIIKKELSDSFI